MFWFQRITYDNCFCLGSDNDTKLELSTVLFRESSWLLIVVDHDRAEEEHAWEPSKVYHASCYSWLLL